MMKLAVQDFEDAVRYNISSAEYIGWLHKYEQVASVLGCDEQAPSPQQFTECVLSWQALQNGLNATGKLDGETWRMLQRCPWSSHGRAAPRPEWLAPGRMQRRVGGGPPWIQIALGEKAIWDEMIASWKDKKKSGAAEAFMSRDEMYFLASPYYGAKVQKRGKVPKNEKRLDWCAAFVNWCLHGAGYSHTGSAGANSFAIKTEWRFSALKEPRQGCVTVVSTGTSGQHVAFLWEWRNLPHDPKGNVAIKGQNRTLKLLGGNQSQRITVSSDSRSMLAVRGMNGVVSPYLWPERGNSNCNHNPSTICGHFAGKRHPD